MRCFLFKLCFRSIGQQTNQKGEILRGIHLHQGIKHVNDLLIQFHTSEDCAFDESKMKTLVDVPTRNTFYIIFSLCHQTISIHEWIIICSLVSSNSDFASFSNNLKKKFFHMSLTDRILSSRKSKKVDSINKCSA